MGQKIVIVKFSKLRSSEVIIVTNDHCFHVFDTETKKIEFSIKGHLSPINSISFHPIRRKFLTCSKEVVFIWDLSNFRKIKTLTSKTASLKKAKFSLDGKYIITNLGNELYFWDSENCKFISKIEEDEISYFTTSKNGKYILVGHNKISMYNAQSFEVVKVLEIPDLVKKFTMTNDNQGIIVLLRNGQLIYLDISKNKIENLRITNVQNYEIDQKWKYLLILENEKLYLYDIKIVLEKQPKKESTRDWPTEIPKKEWTRSFGQPMKTQKNFRVTKTNTLNVSLFFKKIYFQK